MEKLLPNQKNHDGDWNDWRWQMEHCLVDWAGLAAALQLPPAELARRTMAARRYPPLVTPYYLSLAKMTNLEDPILRQVLPDPAEVAPQWAGHPDPLAEQRFSPVAGVVHRYSDRALLILTSRCAVHCRHCLRKRNWRQALDWDRTTMNTALRYLEQHREIREVILSGGDPLLLDDEFIRLLLNRLTEIDHVSVVRIGSRLPVVLPQRFTPELCRYLEAFSGLWLATHFNHPRELTTAASLACRRLLRAGVGVVNQTVLLRGVNDQVEALRELNLGLLRIGVKPYYLFHGDPVAGTRHFRTGIKRGLELVDELRETTSGLAVPAFAIDLPDGGGKVVLTSADVGLSNLQGKPGEYRFKGLGGREYSYADDG